MIDGYPGHGNVIGGSTVDWYAASRRRRPVPSVDAIQVPTEGVWLAAAGAGRQVGRPSALKATEDARASVPPTEKEMDQICIERKQDRAPVTVKFRQEEEERERERAFQIGRAHV